MIRTILIAAIILGAFGGAAYWISKSDSPDTAAVRAAQTSPAAGTAGPFPRVGGVEFWTKRCNPEGDQYCEVFQRLGVKENNQRLIEFAVGYPKGAEMAQAAILLPLGVALGDGVILKVDDGVPAKASFRTCLPNGCLIIMNVPPSFIDSMKTGKKITVSFLDATGKRVNIEMSLEGFATTLSSVTA